MLWVQVCHPAGVVLNGWGRLQLLSEPFMGQADPLGVGARVPASRFSLQLLSERLGRREHRPYRDILSVGRRRTGFRPQAVARGQRGLGVGQAFLAFTRYCLRFALSAEVEPWNLICPLRLLPASWRGGQQLPDPAWSRSAGRIKARRRVAQAQPGLSAVSPVRLSVAPVTDAGGIRLCPGGRAAAGVEAHGQTSSPLCSCPATHALGAFSPRH